MRRLVVIVLILLGGKNVFSQVSDTTLWIPNGPVNAVLLHDSLLYVGGSFTAFSPLTGHFVGVDSTSAAVVSPINQVNGKIDCMAKDSVGYIYVGGQFNAVGSFPCSNLFRLTPQGNFDPTFLPNPDGEVFSLYVYWDKLFIGGDFQTFDGFSRGRGASLYVTNTYTVIDTIAMDTFRVCLHVPDTLTDFDPRSNGPIYTYCMDTLNHDLITGGNFSLIGGTNGKDIAKLEITSGNFVSYQLLPWSAQPLVNGAVRCVKVIGNHIYMGGDFTAFGTNQRKGLAVLNLFSGALLSQDEITLQPAYNAGINGTVRDIEMLNNSLYIAGNFSVVDANFRSNLACVDDHLNLLPWNPSAGGPVYDLAIWDSVSFCVGGNFKTLGTDTCYYAGIIDTNGFVHAWNAKFDDPVTAVMPAMSGSKFWAGGDFQGAGGVLRNNFCTININTKRPNNWSPVFNSTVTTLAADNSQLFVSGSFSNIGSNVRGGIASFDFATNTITSFNPGVNGFVRTMVSDNTKLYLGGNFTSTGNQSRNNIACIDIASSQATNWNPGCSGTVNKILLDGDHVYVGGFFTQTGGQMRANLARVSASAALADFSWSCDTDNGIYDMNLYNGKLYIGGWFQQVASQSRNYFAAVDTTTGNLLSFNPAIGGYIHGIERYNSDIFLAGAFTNVNGNQATPYLADYDVTNGSYDPWSPLPNDFPESMQASQNWLYIGGTFLSAGYHYHPYLAMISINYVTGISSDVSSSPQLKVFPNPTSDVVFVSTSSIPGKIKYVELMDVNGKVVSEYNPAAEGEMLRIDLSEFPTGMYLLRISDADGNVASARIVKN